MTIYLVNSSNPTGYYFSYFLREEDVFSVDNRFNQFKLGPWENNITKQDFVELLYSGDMWEDEDEVVLITDNEYANRDDDAREIAMSTVSQDIPFTVVSDFSPFGGVKSSNFPVSQADNFYPRFRIGFDNTWLANFVKANSIFNREDVRMIIQPTVLSSLSTIDQSSVANYGLVNILDSFVKSFKYGHSMAISEKTLSMAHDIIHPYDTFQAYHELKSNRKRGVFVVGSLQYPLTIKEILRRAGRTLTYGSELPTLEMLPLDVTDDDFIRVGDEEYSRRILYETHTDPSKLVRKTEWANPLDQDKIVDDLVSHLMKYEGEGLYDVALDILFMN